jgi:hypothetical protein
MFVLAGAGLGRRGRIDEDEAACGRRAFGPQFSRQMAKFNAPANATHRE